ncbi:MAG: heavy metal translocating P-type ATPase [Lachnospiraceae bacterium]|nr:heavy metal translocating P-type ATPase [uncultured Acetatifactor sp.]MCI8287507.1 heavy metal translocating P-type ATPase [Lachnospiraceae bacterium]
MKERYHISGMTCSACSSHVEKAVNKLAGVEKASVNLLTETMEVSYDGQTLDGQEIIAAVEKAGYGAELIIGGAHRPAERGHVSAGDERVSCGGSACAAGNANAGGTGTKGQQSPGRTGGRNSLQKKAEEEDRAMKWRLGISIAFLLPLMYVAMYHMYNEWFGLPIPGFVHRYLHGGENAVTFALTQFLLLLPIVYMNRKFFAVGFKTLRHLSPNMDSLIALGASAAIIYGIFALYRISYGLGHGDMALVEQYSHDLYFESAGMILTLITVGKYLESRSKGKTSEAIIKLMDLSPRTAILLSEDGREVEIPTEELRAGDIFLVKPGSLVPVDGTVLEGSSSIDEAAITGESVPVEKQEGDRVVSATVNKAGFLKCRADRVGEDTTLSQIIRLVEEASASKAPIAQLADKVAGVFVPVVICIALVTLAGWLLAGAGGEFAISTAIAVLVISCPCALGLATPVAIMVGTGVGAGHGILIKSGEALQQARETDTVVMDKTGTITAGKLKCMQVNVYVQDMATETLVQIAAALEKKSEHPLAEAVVEHAASLKLSIPEVREFKAVFGRGVEGRLAEDIPSRRMIPEDAGAVAVIRLEPGEGAFREGGDETGSGNGAALARRDAGAKAGTQYFVGNQAYLEENGIPIDKVVLQGIAALADEGMTPLLAAEKGRFLGIIGVADEVKSSSREAIRRFKEMGIHVVMLTGDNRRTAEAVRKRLDIEEVVAEVLPQDKEKKIRQLREQGHKVAMIGDGINDAPALAAADVGMAIGAGTDVAMESADIILMKSDLRDAVTAVRLSRAVIRNIKQNLFWAFFYNAIGIPLAAGVWYPVFGIKLNPMFGAAAMSLSSVFVVGNALRLKGFKSGFRTSRVQTAQPTRTKNGKTEENNKTEKSPETDSMTRHAERKETMTKIMTIEGMMCGHCTGRVQKALEAVEGVSAVTMSLEEKTATVELGAEVADEKLTAAVSEAGYEVTGIGAK